MRTIQIGLQIRGRLFRGPRAPGPVPVGAVAVLPLVPHALRIELGAGRPTMVPILPEA